jgi:light-regulated signal transduction histidine kinase (bacteriophytochrome)
MNVIKEPVFFANPSPPSGEAFFWALWKSGAQAVAVLSEGKKWEFNDAFLRLFRFSPMDAQDAAATLFSGENIQMIQKVWNNQINGFDAELKIGQDRIVRIQVVAVASPTPINQALLLAHDVTDSHIFQEELLTQLNEAEVRNGELKKHIEAAQQLENFAWVASHDLKEPVRNISSFAHLLEKRYADKLDDQGREFLGFIRNSVAAMNALIEDLTQFGQVTSSEMMLELIDPKAIFENVNRQLQRKYPNLEWSLTFSSEMLASITADREKFFQLVYHLLYNSLKFKNLTQQTEISVGFKSTNQDHIFSIKDNGIGIAPEFFDRIFQLFKRLHARQVYDGSGIGLAICKKIMEQHRGRIWVESELGVGSTFYFSFKK